MAHLLLNTRAMGLYARGLWVALGLALAMLPRGARAADSTPTRPATTGRAVSATALVGSGLSIAPGPRRTVGMRSPAVLLVDAGFFHPEHTWLEFSPSVMVELERGQLFGVGFRLRAFVPVKHVQPYAMAGVEAFLAPYKLLGTRISTGMAIPMHPRLALTTEAGPTIYFRGDDLPEGSIVTKLDVAAGLRVTF